MTSSNLRVTSTPDSGDALGGTSQGPSKPFAPTLTKERIISATSGTSTMTTSSHAQVDTLTDARGLSSGMAPAGFIFVPPSPRGGPLMSFVTRQKWQGYVVEADDETFSAVIYDMTNTTDMGPEQVVLPKEEVSTFMQGLIKPGSIFFWDIGFRTDPVGQRSKQSILSFPMIPVWDRRDIRGAKERARDAFTDMRWDKNANTPSTDATGPR
jgi:hypothetical protein